MTINKTLFHKITIARYKALPFFLIFLTLCKCNLNITGYSQHFFKGMNIFFQKSTRNVYRPDEFREDLRQMRSLGVNTLFLIPLHYCSDQFSDTIKATKETIEDSVLESIIISSQQQGFNVILKPHIDLENGNPRYQLKPSNLQNWLRCYRDILYRYVELSNKYTLSHLVIGTEIDNIADSPLFYKLIQEIRNIYPGVIIYSSSFDHFLKTDIWQHVDVIGINTYYNLCNNDNCSKSELAESWNYWLTHINNFASEKGKPVFITECGFYSREGCAINPGDWSRGGNISQREQAKSYEALLCQAAAFTNIKGIFFWQWELNNPWNDSSRDYTPEGKEAEQIIRKYWHDR